MEVALAIATGAGGLGFGIAIGLAIALRVALGRRPLPPSRPTSSDATAAEAEPLFGRRA